MAEMKVLAHEMLLQVEPRRESEQSTKSAAKSLKFA